MTWLPWRRRVRVTLGLCVFAVIGCGVFGTDYREYVARVDSIEAPASARVSEPLTVRLVGTVGSDGCHTLDRIETHRSPGRIDLTVRARERVGGGFSCTQIIVPLDEEITFQPPFADPLVIVAHNDPGDDVSVVLRVE